MQNFDIRSFVRTRGPITLFVAMTIAGASIIWFGKLYDLNINLVTTLPILMMFTYLVVNMLPGLRVQNEQAGDNLYYMGFIFTLTSLGISLYKFTGQASIEDIVRNFGIAILSTITGIALRIFFNQMRRDPADIEQTVRHELAEMTRRVRTELDTSAMEFSSYRRTSNQMLSEGFEEIARQAERNGEAVRVALESMALKATQPIQEASERLISTLEQTHAQIISFAEKNARTVVDMTDRLNSSVEQVADRAGKLAGAIEAVTEKYASAKSPDEVLRMEVAPAMEAIRSLADNTLDSIRQNAVETRETAKKVLTAIAPFKQTAANLSALSVRIDAASAVGEKSAEAMDRLLNKVDESMSVTRVASEKNLVSSDRIVLLADAISASVTAGKALEDQDRARGERIESALEAIKLTSAGRETAAIVLPAELTGHAAAATAQPLPEDAVVPNLATEVSPEEEKPKRSFWSR